MQAQDLGTRLHAQLRIKVGERLIHQEDGWLADDRAPKGNALALAARQLLRLAGEELGEVKDCRRLVDTALDLALLNLAQLEAEGEVLSHGHMRVEGVALEDHGNVAVLRRDVVDDLVADQQGAIGDLLKAGNHAERGGFAAARGPYEHHELAISDLKGEVFDGEDLAVLLGDTLERDRSHMHPPRWLAPLWGHPAAPRVYQRAGARAVAVATSPRPPLASP